MTAKKLRDRIRRGIERLEQEARREKNSDSSSITEVVKAEGKIEACQEMSMLLDTIPVEETFYLPDVKEIYESPIEERHAAILRAAQIAVGKRLEDGRRKEDVLIRLFTAYRLRQEGFSVEGIGAVMGRDHSTVVHYVRRRLPDMLSLPNIYRREKDMFDKMNEILDNE